MGLVRWLECAGEAAQQRKENPPPGCPTQCPENGLEQVLKLIYAAEIGIWFLHAELIFVTVFGGFQ